MLVALSAANAPCPVPPRVMVCGFPGASLVRVNMPARAPLAVGLKMTFSVQKPPAPMPAPQLFVTAKSPVAVMPVMFKAAVPVLIKVTVWAVLVLAMFCVVNLSLGGRPVTNGVSLKVAVTVLAISMVTVQVAAVPTLAQAPPQDSKLDKGLAVRVTTSPAKYPLGTDTVIHAIPVPPL